MRHPILSVWALTVVALLLSMVGSGGKHESKEATNDHGKADVAENAAPTNGEHKADGKAVATDKVVEEGKKAQAAVSPVPALESETPKASIAQAGSEEAAPVADLGSKTTEDLLLMAREAFWNNGLEEAAGIYQQLIEREPHVVEHKGELGNVYWRQGFPEKSANLYVEIAIPMIDKGNGDRVANMVGFIGLFHPKKAAEISEYLKRQSK